MVVVRDVMVHDNVRMAEGVRAKNVAEELPACEPDVEVEGAGLRAEVEGVVRDAVGEVEAEEGAKVSSVEGVC